MRAAGLSCVARGSGTDPADGMNVFAMSVGPGHVQPAYASQLLPQFERSFSNELGRQRLDIEVAWKPSTSSSASSKSIFAVVELPDFQFANASRTKTTIRPRRLSTWPVSPAASVKRLRTSLSDRTSS